MISVKENTQTHAYNSITSPYILLVVTLMIFLALFGALAYYI